MEFSFQPWQLIQLLIVAGGVALFFKVKSAYKRVSIVAVLFVVSLFSPVRFKQEGGGQLERYTTRPWERTLPPPVVEPRVDYDKRTAQELELQQERSANLEGDIHD